MGFAWPEGFERVPDEEWARGPLEQLALKYDSVEDHGWYRNLDKTVEDLAGVLKSGDIVLDYSGGTGILAGRLLEEVGLRDFGILIVDSSPKFLRLAVEKLGRHERIAFRHIRYLKEPKRLETLDEVLEAPLRDRGVDVVVSTNAVHLYYGLADTVASWRQVLRPGGRLLIQSGNIGVEGLPEDSWIIDETVEAIDREARLLVQDDDRYAAYRDVLQHADRMDAYTALRRKFFLPVRPLSYYVDVLREQGFGPPEVETRSIEAHVDQWYEFLSAYHEGVLGWVGGSPRVEGKAPSQAAVDDRLALIRNAMDRIFGGRDHFDAMWTYISTSPGN